MVLTKNNQIKTNFILEKYRAGVKTRRGKIKLVLSLSKTFTKILMFFA
jgi:hypothetical protein